VSVDKGAVRATIFAHLRGIVLAPVVRALCDRGVFERGSITIEGTRANPGYLHVALRLLESEGWLQRSETGYALTAEGAAAIRIAPPFYREVVSFIPMAIFLEDFLFGKSQGGFLPMLQVLVEKAHAGWDPALPAEIRLHLDGMLIGPAMVALARKGIFDKLQAGPVELEQLEGNHTCLSTLFDLLATTGWITREQNLIGLTEAGKYAASIAHAYGVTVSYLPMFSVVNTLLFGNPRIPRADENGVELLVNRAMNVWGGGGSHRNYYSKIDEIVVEIFNRPLELQPSGICDIGCGDGTLLEHLYRVVRDRTLRGKVLDEYPLLVVGADVNKVSRRIAKQNLKRAQIPDHHVIHGDINRPSLLANDLELLGVDIHDLLHVRSFLDHNRAWQQPAGYVRGTRKVRTTGVFAHLGDEIPADELEENLVRHLRRWAPYVGRFGLLMIELHTLPPEEAAANLDKSPAVAYDGTHGFSDQYLVELPVFLACAKEAGLHANPRFQASYSTISINFLTAPQA
jgi:SAM-dependent methyltransferase